MMFKDLKVGTQFNWIAPTNPHFNSFFEECIKIDSRSYRCVTDKEHARYGVMKVGSVKAKVYNVKA